MPKVAENRHFQSETHHMTMYQLAWAIIGLALILALGGLAGHLAGLVSPAVPYVTGIAGATAGIPACLWVWVKS
jgi:hypothetical protein